MATPAWISLGSNLGDRKATLDAALLALDATPGVAVRAVSSYHETRPVGGPLGQGAFLNAAAKVETTLEPPELLRATQAVEAQLGRVREVRWGERTLDLDLLIFGSKFLDSPELKLPHPRLAFRRFVLVPLAEIAPTATDTLTRRTIADLLANLDRVPRLLALDGMPAGPARSDLFRRIVEALGAVGVELRSEAPRKGERMHPWVVEFLAQVRALDSVPQLEDASRWIVTDFYLDAHEIRKGAESPTDVFRGASPTGSGGAIKELCGRARDRGLYPTLVVLPPGGPGGGPKPGARTVPALRPEPGDPDAIVAEVVATCRGIEGI